MKNIKHFEEVIYDEDDPKVGDYVFIENSDYTPDYSNIYKIRDIIQDYDDYDDEKIYIIDNIGGYDDYITIHLRSIVCFSENLEDLEEIRTANKYNI